MRELLTDLFQDPDPTEAARRGARSARRKRFYRSASVAEAGEGFCVLLDGKPVKTPARHALAAPTEALAETIAAEWNAQATEVDPAHMPLTRLANAVIDAVAKQPQPVAEEVAKYLGSDLVCYRAEAPAGLVTRQAQHWDPVLAWAREAFGARFQVAQGVVHVTQPREAIAAAAAAIPTEPWRLGAVASVTTLTGSALLALALAHRTFDVEAVWTAAHVDEDWQMEQWGRDELALARRVFHFADLKAAAALPNLLDR